MNAPNLGGAHIVSAFDADISHLYASFETMRSLAMDMLGRSVVAFIDGDTETAARVVAEDKDLDAMQLALEADVISTLARRSPVADDLRMVVALIKMASIIERVGDHAKNIARRTQDFDARDLGGEIDLLRDMTDIAVKQILVGGEAFLQRDPDGAARVEELDEELDQLFDVLVTSLTRRVEDSEADLPSALHLMFAGKQVERAGDHGVNVARAARYIATGEHPRTQVQRETAAA